MEQVRGVPELLDAYSHHTLPVLERVREVLDRYAEAVAAFNAADPNDLGTTFVDRSADLLGTIDALELLDRIPAAFAAALRDLDAGYDPAAFAPGAVLHADADARLRRLILAGVAGAGASGAERARISRVLRHFDAMPDAPASVAFAVRHEDWRSAVNQFGRHAGNGLMSGHESRRLAALRARYPVSRPWIDAARIRPEVLARTGGIRNRAVLQAAMSADDAAAALGGNTALLPSLGVRIPPKLLVAGRAASRTLGGVGFAVTAVDFGQDVYEGDVGGSISSGAALLGSGMLLGVVGGPVTITAGAVLVVGSLIYEANREEIDAMARRMGQSMSGAARALGDFFDL